MIASSKGMAKPLGADAAVDTHRKPFVNLKTMG